jgi:penicillin amidase
VEAARSALGGPFAGIGSNSWVVDRTRTVSGRPLLANDPQLGIQLPSIWYQATLWCEEVSNECPLRATGFTFPGAPAVVVGHNERIAWGVTNQGLDTMDLFIERTKGDRYGIEGEWVDLETRTERIEVAGGEDVGLEIRSTRHGPVISTTFGALDDLEDGGLDLPEQYEVALAWQELEPSTLFRAVYDINLASDWEEFRRAAASSTSPPRTWCTPTSTVTSGTRRQVRSRCGAAATAATRFPDGRRSMNGKVWFPSRTCLTSSLRRPA